MWNSIDVLPAEDQKVTVVFIWNDEPQLAAGTYHDGQFFQDGGDIEVPIHGVSFWTGHAPPPGYEAYGYPWCA